MSIGIAFPIFSCYKKEKTKELPMGINYKRTKIACFFTYPALAPVFILPPILFYTFRQMYGISYTLLGTLVAVNFCTQLGIDLLFSFFSKYFDTKKSIRAMPLLTCIGMITAMNPLIIMHISSM